MIVACLGAQLARDPARGPEGAPRLHERAPRLHREAARGPRADVSIL